jgi:hypothetical protein
MVTNTTYLNFDIIADGGVSTLVFQDKSQYIELPTTPIVDIIIPGYGEAKTIPIRSSQTNVINSNELQIGCNPSDPAPALPDGIYWITYRIFPHNIAYITKPYLRTTVLDYQFENALLTLNNTPCDEKRERKLKENLIDFIIMRDSAKAELTEGNTSKAIQYYQMAQQILRKFISKCR